MHSRTMSFTLVAVKITLCSMIETLLFLPYYLHPNWDKSTLPLKADSQKLAQQTKYK